MGKKGWILPVHICLDVLCFAGMLWMTIDYATLKSPPSDDDIRGNLTVMSLIIMICVTAFMPCLAPFLPRNPYLMAEWAVNSLHACLVAALKAYCGYESGRTLVMYNWVVLAMDSLAVKGPESCCDCALEYVPAWLLIEDPTAAQGRSPALSGADMPLNA